MIHPRCIILTLILSLCYAHAGAQTLERINFLIPDSLGLGTHFVIDDVRNKAVLAVSSEPIDSISNYRFKATSLWIKEIDSNSPVLKFVLDTTGALVINRMKIINDKLFVLAATNPPLVTPPPLDLVLYKIDLSQLRIDTAIYVTFGGTIWTINLFNNHQYIFIGANEFQPIPTQPRRSVLKLVKFDRTTLARMDTTVVISPGRPTDITISRIFQFDSEHIYAVCGGCKTFSTNINPYFNNYNYGFPGIRKYDFNFNIVQDNIFVPKAHPNFPLEFDTIEYGPIGIQGLVKLHANKYVQFAQVYDHSNPNPLNLLGLYFQDLYLTSFDSNFNQGPVVKFGVPGIPEVAANAVYAGNGKIYTAATTNAGLQPFTTDSLSSILINVFDTSMVMEHQMIWNDRSQIQTIGLQASATGVYVLANTVEGAFVKPHLLRITNSGFPTSIPLPPTANSWQVYPNPAHAEINIQSTERILAAEIFDMQGRVIQRTIMEADGARVIALSSLQAGIYLIRLQYPGGSYSSFRKFIKVETD